MKKIFAVTFAAILGLTVSANGQDNAALPGSAAIENLSDVHNQETGETEDTAAKEEVTAPKTQEHIVHARTLSESIKAGQLLVDYRECEPLPDVLAPYADHPEAMRLLRACGFIPFDTTNMLKSNKASLRVTVMRISGAAVTMAGIGGGYLYNEKVKTEALKYNNFGSPEFPKGTDAEAYDKVQEMRKNIDKNITRRNLLYIAAGAGLSMFTVSLFF